MRRRILFAVALGLAMHPYTVHAAAIVHETLTASLADLSQPALALEPVNRAPHVAYVSSGDLHHAWLTPGGWQDEIAVSGVSGGSTNMKGSVDLGVLADDPDRGVSQEWPDRDEPAAGWHMGRRVDLRLDDQLASIARRGSGHR